ncbi:Forkhead domain [Ceratobasidium sp. AG-Ba]|nr:Forkhead domain [Ceratobasidium sp. AG-Ba]
MSLGSPTTTTSLHDEHHPPLSPPCSSEDSSGLALCEQYKTPHQIHQHSSLTEPGDQPPGPAAAPPSVDHHPQPEPALALPSTPKPVRVKSEIGSPPISLRPCPSPADNEQPAGGHVGSSPTTRALRSLGLTRADLAQHAQRMKSFLVAGGRRGFPSAADLASADVKSEAADTDLLLTQSSTSSLRRQASVVSYTSSVCTTGTTTATSRASSAYPTGPSTNTSGDASSQDRRAPRTRAALPPLPPSSPPEMFSPDGGSNESNHNDLNSSPVRSPLASPARAGPSRTYATTEYPTNNDVPYILPPGPRTTEKPSASYAALIGQAIMSAVPDSNGRKKLTLAHIYAWISAAWPYYKPGEAGWMNSIRHNLSLNDCFVKIKRDGREKGKGSFWSIREGDEDMFANGGFVRRNSAAKKRKKDTTPTREEPPARPADPPKRFKSNPAPANYVYEPPQYPPLPGTSRAAQPQAPAVQPAPKRSRTAAPAPVNPKSYRSPVGGQIPSSSPSRLHSGKRGYGHDYEGLPPELTPNMSSSPDMPGSSPISSSPPPASHSAAHEAPADYPKKSGLMDMVINNSSSKRRVSGGTAGHARVSTLDNGSPVMKRRPNAEAEQPQTIYPASMLTRPGSPTRHINPRAIVKTRADQEPPENRASCSTRTEHSGTSSSRQSEPITPPHGSDPSTQASSLERSGPLVVKPSDIIPSTPPRTLAPLTMATSAERTPLSHAALHMSPSRPSDLSHFKNSVHPPSTTYRDSPSHLMEFCTPLGRQASRVSSLSGSIRGTSGESPMLRTPLGYGGIRDINDLNSGCAEELMASPTARALIATTSTDDQSPSFLFGRMYRSPEGTWGPRADW